MAVCNEIAEVKVDVRMQRAGDSVDMHITARPGAESSAETQAHALAKTVAAVLREHEAAILQERVFGTEAGIAALRRARTGPALFGDGIEPTWLVTPPNALGDISGWTIHAVSGGNPPEPLIVDGERCGRRFSLGQQVLITGCGLRAGGPDAPAQARGMLGKAERLLAAAGADLRDVARTWMWLRDILDWYGDFNEVRGDLFRVRGLLRDDGDSRLPASTGIGIGHADGRRCAMDFVAHTGGGRPRFLLSAGRQGAASRYGSAFSRAVVAETPFGRQVYVSGTASINAAGRTVHAGDAEGQIEETFRCVSAVLRDADAGPDDVVQAVVYCKTPEVERVFREQSADLPFPYVVALSDICRNDLLFEVECTAVQRQRGNVNPGI